MVEFPSETEESARIINEKGVVVEDKALVSETTGSGIPSSCCFHCPSFSSVKHLCNHLDDYADILLLCVKQYHLKSALENCVELLSPKGLAVSFCNGIGNLETVASVVGVDRAAAAVTYEALERVHVTKVIHWSSGKTILADTLTKSTEWNSNILFLYDILKKQRLPVELTKPADARKEIWKKLAVNCVINPLATIIRAKNGLLSKKIPQSIFEEICLEIEKVRVAKQCDVVLEYDELIAQVLETIQKTSNNTCSTLQDIQNGRMTEIEALNGAVVHLARKFGLSTPYCETLFHLIKAMEPEQDKKQTT